MTTRMIPLRRLCTYLLLLLATGALCGGVVAGYTYLSLPDLGFSFGKGDVVGHVQAGGPAARAGLQVGDRIMALDGVSPFAGKLYVEPEQTGLTLTPLRAGQVTDLYIVLMPSSTRERVEDLSYLATAVVFWAIAVVVLTYKSYGAQAQLLALQLLLGALTVPILLLADYGSGWASLFTNTAVVSLGVLIVYYHTLFPERVEFRGRRAMVASLVCVAASLSIAFGWVRLGYHPEWSTPVTGASMAFFVVCVFFGLGLLSGSYRRSASDAGRRQIRVVMLGTALALLPLIVFVLMPQIVPGMSYILIQPAFVALAFIPISYLYAIRRHDLMRIDHRVSQATVHFLLFLVLFSLYLAISSAVGTLLAQIQDRPGSGGLTILQHGAAVVGLMAGLQPLKVRIERLVHRLLYGSWYDYKSFITRITESLGDAMDIDEILDLLVRELTGTMRLKAVAFLIADGQGRGALRLRAQRGFTLCDCDRLSGDLADLLAYAPGPTEQRALERLAPERSGVQAELAAWSEAGAQLWVPLMLQDKVKGVLVLGAKQADELLTRTDLDIMDTLRRHAASAIARAAMVEELGGRLRENQALARQLMTTQERDRQRIAANIHDVAVQEMIGVRMKLDLAVRDRNVDKVASAREDLLDVIDILRSVIGDLRPRAICTRNLAGMLKEQAAAFQRKRGLPITVHVHGNGVDVPEEVRLAIFGVFFEGATNAWKHAGATRIETSLDVRPDRVRLEIEDDGRGFDVPPYLDRLLVDGHLGLMEMRERVALVGGRFDLVSEAGRGSRIVAEVPLHPAQRVENG